MSQYNELLMRGNSTLRKIIQTWLETSVPPLIDIARQQWGLDEYLLPYPTGYNSSDPYQALEYPFCGSYCTGTDHFVRTDVNPSGSISYNASYEATLFVATETAHLGTDLSGLPQWEQDGRYSAMRQRDDLTAIIRASILNTPSLGTASGDSRYRAIVQENTLREAYPEPVKIGDGRNPRWVASGIINVNITMSETTVVPTLGVMQTSTNKVTALDQDIVG